jgi:hypothetical protein
MIRHAGVCQHVLGFHLRRLVDTFAVNRSRSRPVVGIAFTLPMLDAPVLALIATEIFTGGCGAAGGPPSAKASQGGPEHVEF